MRRHPFRLICASLLACVALPWSAAAQTVDVDAETTEQPSDKPYSVFSGYDHLFETGISGRGKFSLDSFDVGIGGRIKISDSVGFSPRFVYELNYYDFTDAAQPFHWQDINQYTLIGLMDGKVSDHWVLLGGPLIRAAGEGSASFDNGTSFGALLGFNYVASKDLSLGLTLGVISQLEDDPAIIPLPTIKWHFADAWTFRTGITQLGGRTGIGPDLTWSINKMVDLGVGAQYQRRRFRLDDSGVNKKGIGEDTSAPLYARVAFHPVPEATIELFTAVVVAGEMQFQDKNGDHTFNRGYDTTPSLGLRGEYRF